MRKNMLVHFKLGTISQTSLPQISIQHWWRMLTTQAQPFSGPFNTSGQITSIHSRMAAMEVSKLNQRGIPKCQRLLKGRHSHCVKRLLQELLASINNILLESLTHFLTFMVSGRHPYPQQIYLFYTTEQVRVKVLTREPSSGSLAVQHLTHWATMSP